MFFASEGKGMTKDETMMLGFLAAVSGQEVAQKAAERLVQLKTNQLSRHLGPHCRLKGFTITPILGK